MPNVNNSINYIELPLIKIPETKEFYSKVFHWEFTDWGPKYISFSGAGIDGGFNAESNFKANQCCALVVLYTENLETKLTEIKNAGGEIIQPIYSFPGGRRFHFFDPNKIELAVWSDKN